MIKKSFFIGGDYNSNGLSWWLPIFFEYCKQKKINRIIFEQKNISKILLSNQYFVEKFNEFEIVYLEELLPWWTKNIILRILVSPVQSIIFFILSFFNYHQFSNQYLKKNIVAIMDGASRESENSFIKINYFYVIKYCLLSGYYIWLGNFLHTKIHSCIMVHNVYRYRLVNLVLKKKKIPIFHISKFCIYRQSNRNIDFHSKVLDIKTFKKLKKLIVQKAYKKYWFKRISGNSAYNEANVANFYGNKIKTNPTIDLNANFVFLHVFRDSPYQWFKSYKNHLFKDYIHWISETIDILKFSDEKWFIKPHPSSTLYVDNMDKLNFEINKKIKNYKHIKLVNEKVPNIKIFQKCKKLVTFSGTASVEYAAFGKKPIIVYPNVLTETIKDGAFFPKTYNQYSDLLLKKIDNKLSLEKIREVQKYLYLFECIVTSEKDIAAKKIFTSTSKAQINDDIRNILSTLSENIEYYKMYGKMLASGKVKMGVAKPFLKKYLDL
tara:strand:- start:22013 stop:23491 length:1479 start_codon:yes stop_codon:yes gene_type:complete